MAIFALPGDTEERVQVHHRLSQRCRDDGQPRGAEEPKPVTDMHIMRSIKAVEIGIGLEI